MRKIGIFKKLFNQKVSSTGIKLIEERGNGFFQFGNDVYKSDIVRACIRPYVKAMSKLQPQHIRDNNLEGFKVNPVPYIRFLYEQPNPLMSGTVFRQKMATQLILNNNAFALIVRDDLGIPKEMYPISAIGVEAKYINNELYLVFTSKGGKINQYPYTDIIHLRNDINENDIFGESPSGALIPLLDIVNTTDQGIIKAIKNSAVIRWLLKFKSNMRPEDITSRTQDFTNNFLDVNRSVGVAGVDSSTEATQIKNDSFVPDSKLFDSTTERIFSFFNTNINIVQSNYTEDQFQAWYESVVEPDAIQWSEEDSRKLFSRRELGFGNKIVYSSNMLQCASISTKLGLVQFVDRSMMTPNEVREILSLPPIEGGEKPLRRLDTAIATDTNAKGGEGVNEENTNSGNNSK